MTFFSDSEMAAFQSLVADLGFKTSVAIYRRSTIQTAGGQGDTYALLLTVTGWIESQPTPRIVLNAGEQATANTYRLYVAVGTDIQPGDRVIGEGNTYTVSDTTGEDTWRSLLVCSLRRLE